MKKVINIALTVVFFVTMFVLTVSARTIHNSQIPNVTATRLTREDFIIEFEYDGGTFKTTQKRLAIKKSIYDSGEVYAVITIIINGEERDGVHRVYPEIGAENEEYYEIISGVWGNELVVVSSDRELTDGGEVCVVEDLL
ncbi:MAG: hypothetical protein FWD34_08900 [Oscillospiraceae bacterium]|nr:hypothetical protein [Oscillospiraceae bacterium]